MSTTTYIPTPTALKMHNCLDKRVRGIMGPPGSGKSVANVMEIFFTGLRQRPTPDGKRLTKWLVVRKTYPNLSTTTYKTLMDWLPEEYGTIRATAPMRGKYIIPLPDGTTAEIELILMSLENPADLDDLNSMEVTGVWINEADEVDISIIAKAVERSGRYPSRKHWPDLPANESHITWRGVLLDYNPPPKGHPLVAYLDSENTPDNAVLFKQPAALIEHQDAETGKLTYTLNPEAENVLAGADGGAKYFDDLQTYQAQGNYDLIETRLLCRYGGVSAGKPVWNNFDRLRHVSETEILPHARTDVLIGIDTSGIHPCALLAQNYRRKWEVQNYLYGDEMGFEEFVSDLLLPMLQTKYGDCEVLAVCDPANARDARTATSPTSLLIEYGIRAVPARTNAFNIRREAVDGMFFRDMFVFDPRLTLLIEACAGEYKYRKLKTTSADGSAIYAAQPDKNDGPWSHVADALQYLALHIMRHAADDSEVKMRGAGAAEYRRQRRNIGL